MSYEPSGLGAFPRAITGIRRVKVKGSKLPHPNKLARTLEKRRSRPHELTATLPRLSPIYVQQSNLSGLGFSLKPPRWVRKLTIKKVIKPLAITAAVVGAAFIPGALPLVGKAAGLLAKGAVGAAKFAGTKLAKPIGSGFMSMFKKPAAVQGAQTQAEYDAQVAAEQNAQNAANQAAYDKQVADQLAANQAAYDKQLADQAAAYAASGQAAAAPPPTYAPQSSGGGYSPQSTTEPAAYGPQTEAQAQAGMGTSSLIPIGIGLIALVAVSGAMKRSRR